ncbi:hypothetical protein GvMRE_I1g601 [endosymbiont GvMRE of Glomus versiforme]|nr:hypothetical protein GvMRE_I1g601 [endosymbiont GvMRE of Glomus versiforme]
MERKKNHHKTIKLILRSIDNVYLIMETKKWLLNGNVSFDLIQTIIRAAKIWKNQDNNKIDESPNIPVSLLNNNYRTNYARI